MQVCMYLCADLQICYHVDGAIILSFFFFILIYPEAFVSFNTSRAKDISKQQI